MHQPFVYSRAFNANKHSSGRVNNLLFRCRFFFVFLYFGWAIFRGARTEQTTRIYLFVDMLIIRSRFFLLSVIWRESKWNRPKWCDCKEQIHRASDCKIGSVAAQHKQWSGAGDRNQKNGVLAVYHLCCWSAHSNRYDGRMTADTAERSRCQFGPQPDTHLPSPKQSNCAIHRHMPCVWIYEQIIHRHARCSSLSFPFDQNAQFVYRFSDKCVHV